MKRSSCIVALFFVSFTGCSIGQNWGCSRPNIFSRMYNCIHGNNNVGAPCASGACATGGYAAAPLASGPMVASEGCTDCGSSTAGYETYEGTGVLSHDSYVPQQNVYENVQPVPARQ